MVVPAQPQKISKLVPNDDGSHYKMVQAFNVDVFNSSTNQSMLWRSDFVQGIEYNVYDKRALGTQTPASFGPNGYWINGTTFSFLGPSTPNGEIPPSPFPYTKMATMTGVNNTAYSLFHQIDALTIAEDTGSRDGRDGPRSTSVSMSHNNHGFYDNIYDQYCNRSRGC